MAGEHMRERVTGPLGRAAMILLVAAITLAAAHVPVARAAACTTTWNGTAWSNGTPTASSDVCITGPLVVTGTPTWSTLTVESGGGVRIGGVEACPGTSDSLTLSAGGAIQAGGELDVFSSSSCSEGGPGTLIISTGTLTNDGTIQLSDCTSIGGSTCSGGSRTITGDVTNASDGTVDLANTSSSLDGGTFANQGAVTLSGSETLDLPASETFVSDGTVSIGTSSLSSEGTFEQHGMGTVTGGPLDVNGGTLDLAGSGAASFAVTSPSDLDGNVAAGQTIQLDSAGSGCNPGGDLTAAGSFTNAGEIDLNQNACEEAKLILPSGATLTNTGTLTTLNCACAGREIDGSIVNAGGTLTFGDRTTLGGANSTFKQTSGTITINGVLNIQSGPGVADLAGGTLSSTGQIDGSVENSGGEIKTAAQNDEFTVDGNYTQDQGGTLTAFAGSSYPALHVQDSATLNGTLNIVTPAGFTPQSGSTYPVITADASSGAFATLQGQFPSPGVAYQVKYTAASTPGQSAGAALTVAGAHTLTVTTTGSGTVVSVPAGINCGSTCQAQFADGQQVQLLAQPGDGWTFDHWAGACTGTGSCESTITSDASVSATFVQTTGTSTTGTSTTSAGSAGTPTITPTGLAFGDVLAGSSAHEVATITARPGSPLSISHVALSGPAASAYTITADGCSDHTLQPGASCAVTVTYTAPSHPATSGESLIALLTVTDNAASGQQVIPLSGQAVTPGVITGKVTLNGSPVAVTINACQAGAHTCVTVRNSATDGSFQIGPLPVGEWVLEISPGLDQSFVPAQVAVAVTFGAVSNQNIALQVPKGLVAGASLLSATGASNAGEPTISYTEPYTLTLPIPISGTGTPNSTQLLTDIAGAYGDEDDSHPGRVYLQEAALTMAVHYGSDGRIDAVSNPLMGLGECGSVNAPTAGCVAAAQSAISPGSGAPARPSVSRGPPTARAAEDVRYCLGLQGVESAQPPVKQLTIPTANGGIVFREVDTNGDFHDFELGPAQIPTLSGNHPWINAVINVGNAGLNVTEAGWYNAAVGGANALVNGQRSSGLTGARYYASAVWQIASQGFGARYHGVVNFFYNLTTSDVNKALEPDAPNTTPVASQCVWHANAYIDPSGTVETTTKIPLANAKVTLTRSAIRTGKQTKVPNRSTLMSPANRRNPLFTNGLGTYGWDVLPGFYRISATHPGCTAATGRGSATFSKLLPVPPPQTGVNLRLRCGHVHRAIARLRLAARAGATRLAGGRLTATIVSRGHAPLGTVTFRSDGRLLGSAAVDPRTHTAMLPVPTTLKPGRTVTATYSGDAYHAPATVRGRVAKG